MKRAFVLGLALCVAIIGVPAMALNVGDTVSSVTIRDSGDKPAQIPALGQKVLTIYYTDADAADNTDPLADALKAKKYPDAIYDGQGIANLKDSKAPNFLIRKIIKGKEEKYNTKILTDPAYLLKTAWGLADCNNAAVVIIVGKDKKVKYINYVRKVIDAAEVAKVVSITDGLLGIK